MPNIFKANSSNAGFASTLRQKLNQRREGMWANYVYQMSKLYQAMKAIKEDIPDSAFMTPDSKLLLIKKNLTALSNDDLAGSDGYILDPDSNKVYQIVPNFNIMFNEVSDESLASYIRDLISKKNESIREASYSEMYAISKHRFNDQNNRPITPAAERSHQQSDSPNDPSSKDFPNANTFIECMIDGVVQQIEVENKFRTDNPISLERNIVKSFLHLSWFSRPKEDFSWLSMLYIFWVDSSSEEKIFYAPESLDAWNKIVVLSSGIENELKAENPGYFKIQQNLATLRDLLNEHERRNVFMELLLAIAGIIAAPCTFLIGFICIIPAALYDLPYLGTSSFFFDTLQWFVDSLLTAVECLVFPLAMMHAYNRTGSSNILKGECTRIVETLSANVASLRARECVNDRHSYPMLTARR